MIFLRNLKIEDAPVEKRELVLDGISEIESIILDNYKNAIDREIAIEFNIGSRLGEPKEFLVVYVNPEYINNPYIFVLKKNGIKQTLVKETGLNTFQDLADLDSRKEIIRTLAIAFRCLPNYAFLSEKQIEEARAFAEEYDER